MHPDRPCPGDDVRRLRAPCTSELGTSSAPLGMRKPRPREAQGLLERDWDCPARGLVLLHADGHMLLPVPTGGSARGLREGGQTLEKRSASAEAACRPPRELTVPAAADPLARRPQRSRQCRRLLGGLQPDSCCLPPCCPHVSATQCAWAQPDGERVETQVTWETKRPTVTVSLAFEESKRW